MIKFTGLQQFTELLFAYYIAEQGEDGNRNFVISTICGTHNTSIMQTLNLTVRNSRPFSCPMEMAPRP